MSNISFQETSREDAFLSESWKEKSKQVMWSNNEEETKTCQVRNQVPCIFFKLTGNYDLAKEANLITQSSWESVAPTK